MDRKREKKRRTALQVQDVRAPLLGRHEGSRQAEKVADELTYCFGEPMVIDDMGMVDYVGANGKPLQFRVGVARPVTKDE